MKMQYLVLAMSALLAVALAVPVLGGSAEPTARSAASAKKLANKALKKAKSAQQAADAITGRSAYDDFCDPSSAAFTDCVGATLSLSRSGRVVITAGGGQDSLSALAEGDCRLEVDDATAAIPHSTAVEPGEDDASGDTSPTAQNGFAVTAVTGALAAGSHSFELSCSQDGGDTTIYDSTISAVRISG